MPFRRYRFPMELAKITSKGQITLPVRIRRALGLREGDKVAFVEMDGQFILANPTALAVHEAKEENAQDAQEG